MTDPQALPVRAEQHGFDMSEAELDDVQATDAGWFWYSHLRLDRSHDEAMAHILTFRLYAANDARSIKGARDAL